MKGTYVYRTLGNFATKLITDNQTGITRVHGKPQTHTIGERTVRVFPIFHPAAILRNPNQRPMMDADFAALRKLLDEPPPQQHEPRSAEAPTEQAVDAPLGSPPAAAPTEDQLDIFGRG